MEQLSQKLKSEWPSVLAACKWLLCVKPAAQDVCTYCKEQMKEMLHAASEVKCSIARAVWAYFKGALAYGVMNSAEILPDKVGIACSKYTVFTESFYLQIYLSICINHYIWNHMQVTISEIITVVSWHIKTQFIPQITEEVLRPQ